MPELIMTTSRKVRYNHAPAWTVPESDDHYPDDYAGRVVGVLPADDESDPGGAVDVVLDITDEQARRLACRELKIIAGAAMDVTFDDRWGAAADMIRAEFVDAEQAEEDALLERAHPDLVVPELQTTSLVRVPTRGFDEITALARKSLPKNVAHTGTGYYAVKAAPTKIDRTQSGAPVGQVITFTVGGMGTADAYKGGYITNVTRGETRSIISHVDDATTLEGNLVNWLDTDDLDVYDSWSLIQGALDRLWIDQGAAAFTASQYIRVYAGTYVENVVPNGGLTPDIVNGYLLVVEGDPADDRANIKLDPAAGHAFNINCDQIRVRHMWMDTVGASYCLYSASNTYVVEVLDCKVTAVASTGAIRCNFGARIEDCEITLSGDGRAIYSSLCGFVIKSCKITGPGKATSTSQGIAVDAYFAQSPTSVESTVVSGFDTGILIVDNRSNGVRLVNMTFYDCTVGIESSRATCAPQEVINCIFKDCTYNYQVIAWPEETTTQTGPAFVQRNNIYHGYTAMGYNGASTKTYAEWIAFGQVDDAGEIDAVDPELVDPDNGDFSLEPTSPCRHAGHGSGVPYDYTGSDGEGGNEFNKFTPDIGAWSSEDSVSAVTWPSSLPQYVDQPTYAENLADVVERSEMDTGPAKIRRRFTAGIQMFQTTITVTIVQAATLQTFFDTTTQGGSLEFEWVHPRTQVTARMRFLAPPQLTPQGPAYFIAAMALEILP